MWPRVLSLFCLLTGALLAKPDGFNHTYWAVKGGGSVDCGYMGSTLKTVIHAPDGEILTIVDNPELTNARMISVNGGMVSYFNYSNSVLVSAIVDGFQVAVVYNDDGNISNSTSSSIQGILENVAPQTSPEMLLFLQYIITNCNDPEILTYVGSVEDPNTVSIDVRWKRILSCGAAVAAYVGDFISIAGAPATGGLSLYLTLALHPIAGYATVRCFMP